MARTAGWHNYQGLFPRPISKGLYMVGDSVFPGQSTLATAVGGVRTARAALSNQHVWLSGPVAPGAVPATETS
jgi:phytoene dehydrogenase-like protein